MSAWGTVSWRHVLDEADGVDALAWAGGALVSLSGGGRMLRAWAPADGALLWESQVFSGDEAGEDPRPGAVGLLALAADADRDATFASFSGGGGGGRTCYNCGARRGGPRRAAGRRPEAPTTRRRPKPSGV